MSSTRTIGASTLPVPEAPAQEGAAKQLRILYVEQNVDGTIGGSYRSLLYLLKGLDRRTYAPVVVFYRSHELLSQFEATGCRTMVLYCPQPVDLISTAQRLGRLGGLLAPVFRIIQRGTNLVWVSGFLFVRGVALLLRERIDVLHLNNGVKAGLELLVASKLLGVRSIIHQRGITDVPSWCRWLSRRADHVICVSDAARDNLIAHGLRPERCTAIHNGINFDELRRSIRRTSTEVRASIGVRPDTLVVGLAGMIRPWKGQMVLVKAMDLLRHRHTNIRALIMGGVADTYPQDRAYLDQIRAYIAERGLGDYIAILDHQPNAPDFLQIFDVMVHAAIEPEPFSRVVIEGMALGRPIVATATGGTPEAIEDGISGFLVPPDDPAALADRIERLVNDPALRHTLGTSARQKAERRFHIQTHVSRTEDIYRRITGAYHS